jgi:hypothetical protein
LFVKGALLGILEEGHDYPLALPSLPEQQEIVRRVEAFLALADQIETRYAKAQAHVEKLTPRHCSPRHFVMSSCRKNDEPTEKLLQRIGTEAKISRK